jgi:hypothetical protein
MIRKEKARYKCSGYNTIIIIVMGIYTGPEGERGDDDDDVAGTPKRYGRAPQLSIVQPYTRRRW